MDEINRQTRVFFDDPDTEIEEEEDEEVAPYGEERKEEDWTQYGDTESDDDSRHDQQALEMLLDGGKKKS